jgi:hypothetical protein
MSKILDEVIQDFRNREERGIKKYGVTMDRDDLLSHEWIQHLIEELQDAILYLKKIQTLQNGTQRHTDSQEANSGNVEQTRSSGEIINP